MNAAKHMKRVAEVLDLDRLTLPAELPVIGLRYQPIIDQLDKEALDIVLFFDEATPDEAFLAPVAEQIKDAIRAALRDAEIEDWPFFWFRRPSEPGPFPY